MVTPTPKAMLSPAPAVWVMLFSRGWWRAGCGRPREHAKDRDREHRHRIDALTVNPTFSTGTCWRRRRGSRAACRRSAGRRQLGECPSRPGRTACAPRFIRHRHPNPPSRRVELLTRRLLRRAFCMTAWVAWSGCLGHLVCAYLPGPSIVGLRRVRLKLTARADSGWWRLPLEIEAELRASSRGAACSPRAGCRAACR